MKFRILTLLTLCVALSFRLYGQANGKLQIHFMDVGQGDGAILISPLGQTVLFDDGALKNCDKPVNYLQKLGVKKIDYHITSHYHSDHIGCCPQVLQQFPLIQDAYDRGGTYNSAVFDAYIATVGAHRKMATAGTVITLDANSQNPVVIRVVALNGNGIPTQDENDLSLDSVVTFGSFRSELGGDLSGFNTTSYHDIETSVAPLVGKIDVYKVHHHGSSHSSNGTWLQDTHPEVGIISCGDGNTYGHPTPETIDALHAAGVKLYWTETGNGAKPEPGMDIVGGSIVVQVSPGASTFTVSYSGNHTDTYAVQAGGAPVGGGGGGGDPTPPPPPHVVNTYAWSTSKYAKMYHFIQCRYAKPDDSTWNQGPTPPDKLTLHAGCPK
jgi:beta-lactamase superfamily II metal-dependent hydrolase